MYVPTGLGGSPTNPGPPPSPGTFILNPQPLSLCPTGTCFNQNMCIPTKSGGFECAPCPDGYTGDGVHCDDVDEVGNVSWVCLCFCKLLLKVPPVLVGVFQCQFNPCFSGVPCVNTAPGFHCGQCPLGYTGPEITGVGVSYAKSNKQVQQQQKENTLYCIDTSFLFDKFCLPVDRMQLFFHEFFPGVWGYWWVFGPTWEWRLHR